MRRFYKVPGPIEHPLLSYVAANEADRLAGPYNGSDIGKLVQQVDTVPYTFWLITRISPLTFIPFARPGRIGAATAITIAAGIATAAGPHHTVNGEGAAADDLVTLNGGAEGDNLILRAGNADITIKDGDGNIVCTGGADITLDSATKIAALFYTGDKWIASPLGA